jgi:thiamine pyrophosphate-dependent acetolactate synthase large subunit-like protein
VTRYGSDVIVDLLIEAGIEHVAFNPGASFRGIHDSLVHTEGAPTIALCLHEAISVAVAQGYAKAAGKPMAAVIHDVVGLQNASMAVYNAWCDRAPMLLIGGTGPKSKATRRPWIDWIHTASVQAEIVRDYVKWDDEPHDLASVPESFARALVTAETPPTGPVYLCYDVDLQEDVVGEGFVADGIARYATPTPPAPGNEEVEVIAGALRSAERPVILAGYVGEAPGAVTALVQLAETVGAAVVDTGVRFAFPTSHVLNAAGVLEILEEADVVLALDVDELRGPLGPRLGTGSVPGDLQLLNVGLGHLRVRGWAHDYQPLVPASLHVTAAGDAAVTALNARLAAESRDPRQVKVRVATIGERVHAARGERRAAAARAATDGALPLERLVYELGVAVAGKRFVLANGTNERLEHLHWEMAEPRQYLGWHGGGGLGYGVGAALGAALALGPETIVVDVQPDGDLLYLPSALWTAAHLQLPLLIVVHNNRQYRNSVEHAVQVATRRGRPLERRHVGAGLNDPAIDLASLAASFGVWSAGPIADPATLAERLADAIAVVETGRPALLDVLTPGS